MIAGGFVNFVSTLGWATSGVLHTVGQAVDLVPPVLFMHVFLAFPDGRLRGRFVRALVSASYEEERERSTGARSASTSNVRSA